MELKRIIDTLQTICTNLNSVSVVGIDNSAKIVGCYQLASGLLKEINEMVENTKKECRVEEADVPVQVQTD